MDVRATWVDRLPARLRLQRIYAMLQPIAFGELRIEPGRDVLSFASFGAKAVPAPRSRRHVCYCYTPPRFLWGPYSGIERERLPRPVRMGTRVLEQVLRRWDRHAAQAVSHFVTQSRYVAERIRRVYGRESVVVPPPVEVERFATLPALDGAYFLIVSRFEAYKRIDLAIEACRRLRVPLRIVGSGVDEPRLRRLAAGVPEVRFLGSVNDQEMVAQLAGCRALLLPGEEDFGLIAVEAQAAGKPVIAYGEGGALETVLPGVTGTFFHELSAEALAETLATFDPDAFDPSAARANAARYAPERFREHLRSTVETLLQS
jgi:glycosyltransferase involved in cell wall biosynthesis